jgi:hypothetical protein
MKLNISMKSRGLISPAQYHPAQDTKAHPPAFHKQWANRNAEPDGGS